MKITSLNFSSVTNKPDQKQSYCNDNQQMNHTSCVVAKIAHKPNDYQNNCCNTYKIFHNLFLYKVYPIVP